MMDSDEFIVQKEKPKKRWKRKLVIFLIIIILSGILFSWSSSNTRELEPDIKSSGKMTFSEPKFSVKDSKGESIADIKVTNKNSKNKTIDLEIKPEKAVKEIQIKDLKLEERNLNLKIEELKPEDYSEQSFTKVYSIDPTELNFSEATVKAVAQGNKLFKCPNWDFKSQKCKGRWKKLKDIIPGEEYDFTLTADDPGFGESNNSVIVLDAGDYLINTNETIVANNSDNYDVRLIPLEGINDTINEIIIYDHNESAGQDELKIENNFTTPGYVNHYAIDPTNLSFNNATITVTAQATRLYKCTDWNFTTQTCYDEWNLFKSGLTPGQTYNFTLTPEDPGFKESISNCIAEDNSDQGSWDTACDDASGSYLEQDDGDTEVHRYKKSASDISGVKIQQVNTSITDCESIDNVELCYEWWADSPSVCDISVDIDGDASWTAVTTTCPGTTADPGVICTNITSLESWTCSNFFGVSGTRAEAKSEIYGTSNNDNGYWDVLYFNVTYSGVGDINNPPTTPTSINCDSGGCNNSFLDVVEINCSGSIDNENDTITYEVSAYYNSSTNGTQTLNVVMLCSASGCTDSNKDVPLKNYITGTLGYNLTTHDATEFDTSNYGVIVISESVNSGDTSWVKDDTVPIVTVEGANWDEIDLGTNGGSTGTADTQWEILNNTHYITQGYSLGDLTVSSSTVNNGQISGWTNGVVALARSTNAHTEGRILIAENGSTLADSTTAAERRVFFAAQYFDPLNSDGENLFSRALDWAAYNTGSLSWHTLGNHTEGNSYTWNITDLVDQSEIDLRCRAIDIAGSNTYSSYYDPSINLTITNTDTTPPSSITNLNNISQGTTWIYWNWTEPADADFNHTEVWINGTLYANVTTNYYNATGLTAFTWYEIQTRTADHTGNVNTNWVNDTAKTLFVDTTNPVINSISDTPDPINESQNITISANVTDNVAVDSVLVGIEGTNYSMSQDISTYNFGDYCMAWNENSSIATNGDVRFWIDDDAVVDEFVTSFSNGDTIYIKINGTAGFGLTDSKLKIKDVDDTTNIYDPSSPAGWSESSSGIYTNNFTLNSSYDNTKIQIEFEVKNSSDSKLIKAGTIANVGTPNQTANNHAYYTDSALTTEWTEDYLIQGDTYWIKMTQTKWIATPDLKVEFKEYDVNKKTVVNDVAMTLVSGSIYKGNFTVPSSGFGSEQWVGVKIEGKDGSNNKYKGYNQFYVTNSAPGSCGVGDIWTLSHNTSGESGLVNYMVYVNDTSNNLATPLSGNYTVAIPDTTPPSSITNLNNISQGETWIYWNWTEPADADFNESIIYIDSVWQLNTSDNFYNKTGLTADTNYTITIHTKDTTGNINNTDVNNTARTSEATVEETAGIIMEWIDPDQEEIYNENEITEIETEEEEISFIDSMWKGVLTMFG